MCLDHLAPALERRAVLGSHRRAGERLDEKPALGVEVIARLLSLAEYWVILYGMGLGVDPWKAFVVASFSSLVVNALIFVPFELGTKEGAVYLMFAWLGIAPALGLAAALLSRLRELIWIAIGWAMIWTMK